MNVNIIANNDNKLLERKEIQAEVSFSGSTPKRTELKEAVGHKVGANPELIALRNVSSNFGRHMVKVTAHAYSSKEALLATEPVHIKVREGLMPKPEKKKKVKAAPARKKE
ncbi:30S ribosomal protein S24e [Candidatus Bilamarchaeum dharawalense]|uniref:Small ribosomal subunit protein eS24 n=1 Tax=Candidatus Bilamarchaeum dharawalense TaxID=2885759 RepID=A0A5E4LTD3_9ARCH|nr:30S ribosomal protein S24e [Candidatus Bilamarchaeum dharawalense]